MSAAIPNDPAAKGQLDDKRPDDRQPHMVFDTVDLDVVVKVLSKTIFSPMFVVFLPLTLLSQVGSSHPAFLATCVWTAIICFLALWKHVDRIYANQATWLLAPPKLKWEDQIVLITGGGSGIGALLAETLAMRNVSVVVLTKYPPQYETINENIYTYICDVSDFRTVQTVAERVREEVGDPTVIVNNAGIVKGKLLLDLTEEDVQTTFGCNTLANFWVLKAFLPAMLRKGQGHIITVSSLLGLLGAAQMSDYCASKAALISLHQTLRFELDNRYKTPAIRTTLVLPAYILTALFDRIRFPTGPVFDFFCPPVPPHAIVKQIISALDANESRVIRLPFYTNLARFSGDGVGLVPAWMRDLMQWLLGADHVMKGYGPSPDAGERLEVERLQQQQGHGVNEK
ncbi:hypothetical protein I350_02919 [Cryptococcus amylolentus CBS 6273]|uniref:Short-chain dehydrogenase/reductase 3 n=1 Tax=Cryptococcus amylolentus CBS 6273 TaxID=1296118 RepID=A0A1E3K8A9_9TREE|nr:hypothetical protein I350_02919 [Cryptococcus amylolentus CBS 6273]